MALTPRPIMAGLFGSTSVNARLREIIDYVNAMEERIKELEDGVKQAESLQEYKEPETVTATEANIEPAFDFESCDDTKQLKAYAFAEYGLTITGNKKSETIIKEIQAHIETLEG